VVGVDLNPGMLTVARHVRPEIDWRQGDAADLPFADDTFDAVLCQSALMFFPDVPRALGEMARVVHPEGIVAAQVWDELEQQSGYGPFVEVAARHAGPEAVHLLSAYWVLGDLHKLAEIFESAGLRVIAKSTRLGTARFDSIDDLVRTEVESTPLAERISDETYLTILEGSREALARFRTDDGPIAMPIQGHLITAKRQCGGAAASHPTR
jgi:SAM-dependent methyltransferase